MAKVVCMPERDRHQQNKDEATRLILLGMTGGGKSSLGNTLLGYRQFLAEGSPISVTEYCQVGYRNFNGRHLVIVDTPGFFDNKDKDKRETYIKIGQSLQTTVPGPHAFLIVLPFLRITEEIKKGWEWISDIFDKEVLNYCIIVFTGLDNLIADDSTVDGYLRKKIPELTELMEKCGNRYIAFNNRASVKEKDSKIQELFDLIDMLKEINENEVFTNTEIKEIDSVVPEETRKDVLRPRSAGENIVLLPQVEKIVVEAYMRKPAIRKDMHNL
ncbi:hypothetical protein I4U23_015566 [Adineta vaga]|nr:hypothetical protein I4U23_015566 [Adineta vaga]